MASFLHVTWSKSLRIKIMIVIDTLFFLLELVSGFLVHSLALTADAFHMLNDIISLVIGLWAVVAAQKETTDEFTFGWVRAEILGAFFNAVFLIALCVSIILEALTRFVEPPEISNPKLILAVGCAGLFSNLVGFFVLGGHGHSHGGEGHDHSHENEHDHVHEHGHGLHNGHTHDEEQGLVGHSSAESSDVTAVESSGPPDIVIRRPTGAGHGSSSDDQHRRIRFDDGSSRDDSNTRTSRASASSRGRDRRSSKSSQNHSRLASIEDMSIHPASFRQEIISYAASSSANAEPPSESESDENCPSGDYEEGADEQSPLLKDSKGSNGTMNAKRSCRGASPGKTRGRRDSSVHKGHNHTLPKKPGKKGGHGHSHGDMGMNAMILHVIGDALGNVGVIVTALIIWLTEWPGKYYADPAVSLFITAIILKTAIPLTAATSRVLLQATPENICIADIREDIEALPGVVSCHHIHVWQLSDTKVVASMHLQVSFPIDTNSGEKYMQLARRARKCLHAFGIHSATIQPEFCLDVQHQHEAEAASLRLDGTADGPKNEVCLLECVDNCAAPSCCPPTDNMSQASSTRRASDSSHSASGSHSAH
ncbi:hypothetical protein NLU13_8257 [Sarocladium strictum]|uniref:Uncharacterized protein n=1 Tax=Sarocladium strictum TaxID=5046 RepID=A0AA39L514_SARSR|nr:hypothetical protein NLU13_8257 [Sarocladium strictum]